MQFQGLDKLQAAFNQLASPAEMLRVNKRIVEYAKPITHAEMKKRVPRSKDHSLSGRNWGKPRSPRGGHAADNIPVSRTTTDEYNGAYANVGWKLSDNSGRFYMKFQQWGGGWGSVRNPPTPSRPALEFVEGTRDATEPSFVRFAENEYRAVLRKHLGGMADGL